MIESSAFMTFMKGLGIGQSTLATFYSQSDGTTERFNQEIELYMAIYCTNNPNTWANKLPIAEYAHNLRLHGEQNQTPFELILEHSTKQTPKEPNTSSITVDNRLYHIENIRIKAKEAHDNGCSLINQQVKNNTPELKIGDKVWSDTQHLQIKGLPRKLSPKRTGLFEILEHTGPVNYKLKLPIHWWIHPNFHIQLL